jgi:hypothetical protein
MKHEGSWRLERQIGIEKGKQKGAERQRSGPLVYKMPVFFLVELYNQCFIIIARLSLDFKSL